MVRKRFDPEGSGYDQDTADNLKIQPTLSSIDGKPHWPSFTGRKKNMLLKGRKHKTYHKTKKIEADYRNKIVSGKDIGLKGDEANRYFSIPMTRTESLEKGRRKRKRGRNRYIPEQPQKKEKLRRRKK